MSVVLRGEQITKTYENGENVLKGISLEIEENTFTVILGQSGSGKSTLLHILSGLLLPSSGKVWNRDTEVTALRAGALAGWKKERTGNIFQNYLLLNNLTVRENILIGENPEKKTISCEELARKLQLEELLDKFPSQLSGGQQQRTAIARAVIGRPELLFCDEATGALDEQNSKLVVKLLHEMNKEYGISVLFVTHNLQIGKTADRILTMKDGKILEDQKNENPISADAMEWKLA